MKRVTIPDNVKLEIVWVEYFVFQSDSWWLPIVTAELQIKQGRN